MSLNIDCQDIYKIIDTEIPTIAKAAGYPIIQKLWDGIPNLIPCKTGNATLSKSCAFIPSIATKLSKLGIDQKIGIDIDQKVIKPICKTFLDNCQPTLCSSGKKPSILVTCNDMKTFMKSVFTDKTIKDKMEEVGVKLPFEFTQDGLCDMLATLADGSIDNLIDGLISMIKDANPKFYNDNQKKFDTYSKLLAGPIKCICPHVENKKQVGKPKYNKIMVVGTLLALFALAIIPFFGVLFTLKPWLKKMLVLLVILVTVVVITAVITWFNPKCLYKPCVKSGDDWIPIQGKFKGSLKKFGVKISAELNVDKNNNVTLDVLTCDGSGCPQSNLLENCKSKKITISNTKTIYGYPLVGGCIDELFKIQTNDKTSVVRGLWLIRNGDKIEIQISLHIGLSSTFTVNQVLLIPVSKV